MININLLMLNYLITIIYNKLFSFELDLSLYIDRILWEISSGLYE